jgi:tRNA (guanine37-N1)-methyltransferase
VEIDVLTLFPGLFKGFLEEGLLKRAQDRGAVVIRVHNIRDFAKDKHHEVDDYPYGGGPGMILKVEPIHRAVGSLEPGKVILMSPQGLPFNQEIAYELAKEPHLILISGHYEGVDERIRLSLVDLEISIGDYILSGGEIPSLVVMDAVVRLIPGVLGNLSSLESESFKGHILEYPQYTRPRVFMGMEVPSVLLSGNHSEILRWRRKEAIRKTFRQRPDLLKKLDLCEEDLLLLKEVEEEERDAGRGKQTP